MESLHITSLQAISACAALSEDVAKHVMHMMDGV